MITVRRATITDLDMVYDLLYPAYFMESGYKNLTINVENSRNILGQYIQGTAFLCFVNNEVAGFGSMDIGNTFYDEVEADCDMFFVLPKFRGTGVSRALVQALCDAAKEAGAVVLYSCGQSAIGDHNNVLWDNLWKKYGFKPLGRIMIKMENENG